MNGNNNTTLEVVQPLLGRLREILPLPSISNHLWQKVEDVLKITFDQDQLEVKNLQQSIDLLKNQLQLISSLQSSIFTSVDVQTVVLRACEIITKLSTIDQALILLYDENQDTLITGDMFGSQLVGRSNSLDSQVVSLRLARKCLQEKSAIVVNDLSISDYVKDVSVEAYSVKSSLVVPIITKQQFVGVLQVNYCQQSHSFMQNEIDFFKIVADNIGVAIENIRLFIERRATQAILKESEESYFQIYEDIPFGLFRSTPDGTFLRLNPAMVKILGYPDRETLLKTNAVQLYKDPQERMQWQTVVETYNVEHESEICLRRYDGSDVWVQHSSRSTRGPNGKILYYDGAIVDISASKRAESQIREAMQEKEILLKEIHHRVKNNLQIISSLLNLQSEYLRDSYDRELFKQSQNRVKAMAFLHERLYQSAEFARVDFEEYLRSMMPSLFQSYKTSMADIECIIQVERIHLDIDTAIPCGLIVGELVANSLKHAFPNGRNGCIVIKLRHLDQRSLQLSVSDDGIGMDENSPLTQYGAPMGWELIHTLTEQLNGSIEIRKQPGTHVNIVFKEKVQKEGTHTQWQIQKS